MQTLYHIAVQYIYNYIYIIYLYIWVNYNDLTVLPHWESWLVREIIPKWANYSG